MTEHEAWLAMDARRQAKRRAQWRDSKQRVRGPGGDAIRVGALHNLGCRGPHRGSRNCVPIPVYDRPVARMEIDRVELSNARIPDGLPVVLNPLPGGRSASSRLRR